MNEKRLNNKRMDKQINEQMDSQKKWSNSQRNKYMNAYKNGRIAKKGVFEQITEWKKN